MKRPTLIPFCVRTGGIPHWVNQWHSGAAQPGRAIVQTDEDTGVEIEWREAAPFAPTGPVEAIGWERGRSAANLILGGPVLGIKNEGKSWAREVRARFYLTQAGVLELLQGGAFDGPRLRPGVLLRPVKQGQNYLVRLHKEGK